MGGLGWTGVKVPPDVGVDGVGVRDRSLFVGVVGSRESLLLGLRRLNMEGCVLADPRA